MFYARRVFRPCRRGLSAVVVSTRGAVAVLAPLVRVRAGLHPLAEGGKGGDCPPDLAPRRAVPCRLRFLVEFRASLGGAHLCDRYEKQQFPVEE